MRKLVPLTLLFVAFVSPALAGPRDYLAILNRCGAPTLGDTTIYENDTVAGGRKIVKYLRGTLHFNRVGEDGWTFMFGEHEKEVHLNAGQMALHMPCLTQALADSASVQPLPVVKADQRLAFSARYHARLLLLAGSVLIILIVAWTFFARRRRLDEDEGDE